MGLARQPETVGRSVPYSCMDASTTPPEVKKTKWAVYDGEGESRDS